MAADGRHIFFRKSNVNVASLLTYRSVKAYYFAIFVYFTNGYSGSIADFAFGDTSYAGSNETCFYIFFSTKFNEMNMANTKNPPGAPVKNPIR